MKVFTVFLRAQEDETKKFVDFEFIYDNTYQIILMSICLN